MQGFLQQNEDIGYYVNKILLKRLICY